MAPESQFFRTSGRIIVELLRLSLSIQLNVIRLLYSITWSWDSKFKTNPRDFFRGKKDYMEGWRPTKASSMFESELFASIGSSIVPNSPTLKNSPEPKKGAWTQRVDEELQDIRLCKRRTIARAKISPRAQTSERQADREGMGHTRNVRDPRADYRGPGLLSAGGLHQSGQCTAQGRPGEAARETAGNARCIPCLYAEEICLRPFTCTDRATSGEFKCFSQLRGSVVVYDTGAQFPILISIE